MSFRACLDSAQFDQNRASSGEVKYQGCEEQTTDQKITIVSGHLLSLIYFEGFLAAIEFRWLMTVSTKDLALYDWN